MDGGRSVSNDCCSGYRVVIAVVVRCLLFIHASVAVWLVVSLTGNRSLWYLLAINVLLLLETAFTVVKRKGRESKWICPCFLVYLAAVLPPVWLVELHRLDSFNNAVDTSNITSLVTVQGLTVPVKLQPDIWVSVIEQTLLFLLVLCRWMLPRGDITRHELSQLLFVFMSIASDNMELFELFDETDVRQDRVLTYVILGVWSLSLLQFVFVLTATKNPRKVKLIHTVPPEETSADKYRRRPKRKRNMCEVIFSTEIWSLLFSITVQDGPYAATRIYTLIKYDLITYSILFFICKNLLIICLVFYRLVILCIHRCTDDDDDDEGSERNEGDRQTNISRLSSNTQSSRVHPTPVDTT